MKKILLIVLFTLSLSINSYSQLLESYKPTDGLSHAIDKAKSDGISAPQLLLIGTYNGSLAGSGIVLNYDLNAGTSTAWAYLISSQSDTNIKSTYVVTQASILGAKTWLALKLDNAIITSKIPFMPTQSLNEIKWIDNDIASSYILKNDKYVTYKANNPSSSVEFVGLAVNTYPFFQQNQPYWLYMFKNNSTPDFICGVNALTGETECTSYSSVNESSNDNGKVTLYPNPSSDNIFIKLSDQSDNFHYESIKIFDNTGNLCKYFPANNYFNSNIIELPVSDLSTGNYIIEIRINRNIQYINFNKIK